MRVTIREVQAVDIPLIKPWLIEKENAKLLDPFFQNESIRDEQMALFLMRKERRTFLVLYDDIPVGLVGLTSIDNVNRSAEIWSILGEISYRNRGIITAGNFLTLKKAFEEFGLHSIHAWAMEGNFVIRVIEKLGFKTIGRQRECHLFDGVFRDRILFDILHSELKIGPLHEL